MGTTGRNRSETIVGGVEQNQGIAQELEHGGPSFGGGGGTPGAAIGEVVNTFRDAISTVANSFGNGSGESTSNAAAEAAAQAAARATKQRKEKDQKIAKDTQKAQHDKKTTYKPNDKFGYDVYVDEKPTGENISHDELIARQNRLNQMLQSMARSNQEFADAINSGDIETAKKISNSLNDNNTDDVVVDTENAAPDATSIVDELIDTNEQQASSGKQKWKPKQLEGQSNYQQQQSSNKKQSSGQNNSKTPATPNRSVDIETGEIEDIPTMRELEKKLFYSRARQARNYNKSLYRQLYEQQRKNPSLTSEEFFKEHPLDQEAFPDSLPSSKREHYRSNKKYEQGRTLREEGQAFDIDESMEQRGTNITQKDTYKQDRLEDQTVWDMKVGFFPVNGENVVVNEDTGNFEGSWSLRVENAMNTIMEDFNGSGIDGQRTVFRMIRLYASMAIDRQGKMFNQDSDKWSLTEQEFIDICECMHRSTLIFGHPFVAPVFLFETKAGRKGLRGTDMYPSGVIPRVVAEAITGEDSAIRHISGPKKGEPMTADELIDACWQEWVNRTQPVMNANLVNRTTYKKKKKQKKTKIDDGVYIVTEEEAPERNLIAQRIAIESAMRAFARVDGMDADEFGSRFNIDTAQHYKLWEYKDNVIEYASALNGKYDSEAVKDRIDKKTAEYERRAKERRGRRKVNEFEASCNLLTSGIKTNALWWNVPVRVSAVAEKGVGNLQTHLTLGLLRGRFANPERYQISNQITDAFRTDEGYKAIDAAYILLEIGGPEALFGFARTSEPMTQQNVIKYLQDNVLREAGSERAYQIQQLNIKLNKFSQRILAGDTAFKKSDITNFFNALMISNQAVADAQEKLSKIKRTDDYAGMSLTGTEMLDIFKANNGDVTRFLTEIMTTSAGKDALMMMKANNIAQFNVISYNVNSFLRDNGISNAMITSFLDSFATYGVNFLYAMIPGSRTFTYLTLKQYERDYDITAGDFAIGGGIGERHSDLKFRQDPGFYNGLKINMMFDAITVGKWVLGTILIGGVLWALGFEPPDDPEDIMNISKWKIGGNVGFGPDTDGDGRGNGMEIQLAYWLNDLTQWGLPLGYAFAVALALPGDTNINGKGKLEIMGGILEDSISDQFDGNVVLDFADCILNWGDDLADIQKTINDPTHEMETVSPFFAMSELGLRAFGKIVPGAPLYRAWGTSALLRGPNARMFSTNKTFDKSSEWAQQVGKTDYIDDPVERLIRKYSAGNWLLGAFMDAANMLSPDADQKTGYMWWEMPFRTKTEPYALALIEAQKMDYDHLEEGETKESYNAKRTDDLRKMIAERGYASPEEAVRDGFFITHDMRIAALDTVFSELNAMKNEYDMLCEEKFDTYDDWYAYKSNYDAKKSELWDFINDWLKNDDIPTWTENYEQLLSDWDVTYVKPDGSPATPIDMFADRVFNQGQGIEAKWKLKGNAPTALLPWTNVQYESNDVVQRGWSGETKPAWLDEDSNLTSFANLRTLGDRVINIGRDAGSTVNDVYYGEEYDGVRLHSDDPTIGDRSWVGKKTELPDDIRNFGEDDASGGIHGNVGKSTGKVSNDGDDDDKPWKTYGDDKPWKTTSYYPRYTYSTGGGGSYGGGSYNYNPKIYSNPRQVNSDRAATMYTKQPYGNTPTSYLRPSFSTKGSREAYRRQDF